VKTCNDKQVRGDIKRPSPIVICGALKAALWWSGYQDRLIEAIKVIKERHNH
jgi:hypothetical protein